MAAQESTLLVKLQTSSGDWVDVGYLRSRNERNWFEFADSYWSLANRPVLGQIFEEHGRFWRPSARTALPHWFSHLLPEGRLRAAVAHAADVSSKREFELLSRLGATDLPGAVRAIPVGRSDDVTKVPSLAPGDDSGTEDPLLKFSLAGIQLKFSVYGDSRGLTVPTRGQVGNCIVKFPDGRPGFGGVPEAELGCLDLARQSGIDAPNARLVAPSEVAGLEEWSRGTAGMALAIQRFDRGRGDFRIHMEELAQILNIPTARQTVKYTRANFETIAIFVSALCGVESVGQVIDRIVLNVLVGNGDAHLKNWAVLYPDGKRPALSPVYDIVSTVLYMSGDNMGLNLNGSKSFEAVSASSFDRLGYRTGYGAAEARQRVRDAVDRIRTAWPVLDAALSAQASKFLADRKRTLKLLTE